MSEKLGIIGFGNIAQAIATSLLEKNLLEPEDIICLVKSKKSVEEIKNNYKYNVNIFESISEDSKRIWNCPIKLLSVKPQQLKEIEELKVKSTKRNTMISILAGVSINRLKNQFPNHNCARAVTNIPITIGKGLTGISWGQEINNQDKIFIREIFNNSGKLYEFPEEYLDVFLALTSSAPAIIALIIESLADGGLSGGLQKNLSEELVIEMILGTVMLLRDSKISTSDLKNKVTSPAGTTISALRVLEERSFRSALMESIIEATKKSKTFK